jgi:hypothetical protein
MLQYGSVKGNLCHFRAITLAWRRKHKVVSARPPAYSTGNFGVTPMRELSRRLVIALILIFTCSIMLLSIPWKALAADDEPLNKEQIKQFLQTADIIKSRPSPRGITHPLRLTLSNGKITHDASFQAIDEHKSKMDLGNGKMELDFVDSYKYNLAAYQIAELLGVDYMLPVYVERKWEGKTGSLSWWLPVKMDDAERFEKKIEPPNADKWNQQMFRIRVFDELVYDTDPNLTNVLIGEDWTVYRVDFSRAFRKSKELRGEKNLVKCDRQLFEKLKALRGDEVAEKTRRYLTKDEINGVMARRDKIVAKFQSLIAQKGEKEILY